jgi:hypothetical protein
MTQPNSNGLTQLKQVLSNPIAQKGLIALYSQSQSECTRNGVCGMEIGMAREKDQGAVLKLFLGDLINLEIDNTLPEDFLICNEKISSKHSSGPIGTPIKAKWTSADTSVQEAIQSMIHANDSYYPNLLLTYIQPKIQVITIICISAHHNKQVIQELKEGAFTVPKGNSRGIEYSRLAMKNLLEQPVFTIVIRDANIQGGMHPITRRIQTLHSLGIHP